jgi:hypothetical protein
MAQQLLSALGGVVLSSIWEKARLGTDKERWAGDKG